MRYQWVQEVRDIVYRFELAVQNEDMAVARKVDKSIKGKKKRQQDALESKGAPSADNVMDKLFMAHLRCPRRPPNAGWRITCRYTQIGLQNIVWCLSRPT